MTRADYMEGRVSHREYYAEVCRIAGLRFLSDSPIVRRAANSTDPHFNDITLRTWDLLGAGLVGRNLARAFEACGDFDTMAGRVCAVKEAVRQAVESQKDAQVSR